MRFRVKRGTVALGDKRVIVAGDIVELPESMATNETLERVDEASTPTREVQAASIVAEEVQPAHHEWKRKRK